MSKRKYNITAVFNEQTFNVKSESIKEAYVSLKPDILRSNVAITVTSGKKKAEKFLFLREANRAFRNPVAAEILEKQILTLL